MSILGWFRFGNLCSNVLRPERQRNESLVDCLNRVVAEAQQWRKLVASKPESAPQNQDGPAVWPLVIADLERESVPIAALVAKDALERHEFGVAKYGVPLVANNGRNHLRDAYQELLDLIVYLRAHCELTGYGNHTYREAIDMAVRLRRALEPT